MPAGEPPLWPQLALAAAGLPALVRMWRTRGADADPLPAADPPAARGGVALFAAALLFTMVAGSLAAYALGLRPGAPLHAGRQLMAAGAANLAAAALVLILLRRTGAPDRRTWPAGPALRTGAVTALAFLPVAVAAGLLVEALHALAGREPVPQRLVLFAREASLADFLLVAAFAVVAAPLAEEALFRGALYGGLRALAPAAPGEGAGGLAAGLGSRAGAAATSALAFSLVHWEEGNPAALPTTFLLGLFLAGAAERTGGLLAPMALHAGYNGAQVLALAIWRAQGA